jgi:hypothetical protein
MTGFSSSSADFGGCTGWYFYGNIYYTSSYWQIVTKAASASIYEPIYIYNNTFYTNAAGNDAWVSKNAVSMTGTTYVYNNIFYNVANRFSGAPGCVSDYNAYFPANLNGSSWPTSETHSFAFAANPFVALPGTPEPVGAVVAPWGSAGDFHLTAAGIAASPQFNNGSPLTADGFINVDLSGQIRGNPTWTIGAYQYVATAGPAGEQLSDEQLELLEREPGVSSAEVEAESERAQLKLHLKQPRKHPGRQEHPNGLTRVKILEATGEGRTSLLQRSRHGAGADRHPPARAGASRRRAATWQRVGPVR